MKKTKILLVIAAVILLTGCSSVYNYLADVIGGNIKVEMPKPSVEYDKPAEAFTPIDTNSENVQKVIKGLQLLDEFKWEFESTYIYKDSSMTYKSTVCVKDNQYKVDVYNYSNFISSAVYDGEYLYNLDILQEVVKKSQPNGLSYRALAMAADIESLFPLDDTKIMGTYLSAYEGENVIYIEVKNGTITEKYYLSEEDCIPLYAECSKEGEIYYTLKTLQFSDEPLDPEIFTVESD